MGWVLLVALVPYERPVDRRRELGLATTDGGTVEGSGRERLHVDDVTDVTFAIEGLTSLDYSRARIILEPNGHLADPFE